MQRFSHYCRSGLKRYPCGSPRSRRRSSVAGPGRPQGRAQAAVSADVGDVKSCGTPDGSRQRFAHRPPGDNGIRLPAERTPPNSPSHLMTRSQSSKRISCALSEAQLHTSPITSWLQLSKSDLKGRSGAVSFSTIRCSSSGVSGWDMKRGYQILLAGIDYGTSPSFCGIL